MKFLIIIIFALYMYAVATAHTVVWQMMPSQYDDIERINTNLYKVSRNGKIGLIHSDGEIVAEPENDALSLFHEHYAIMTQADGYGERVTGCLTDDGRYYSFANKYYSINGQKFYSDGALSVADENGSLGYIDCHGNPIVGFDGKYDRIKPFAEGYAAVFKNKKYYLIDKDGNPVRFRFKGFGQVNGGTNVHNGTVYIWDTDGKFHTFDVKNGGVCKSVKKPADIKTVDYLYRFACISGDTKEIPFVGHADSGTKGLEPDFKDGKYGFYDNENTILPHQLTSATNFVDGLAVARLNGQLGILRYVNGEDFSVTQSSSTIKFYDNDSAECEFNLHVPSSWQGRKVNVRVSDGNGYESRADSSPDNYSFSVNPGESGVKEFVLTVYGDGLKLHETSLSYSFIKKFRCATCGKDKDICRGHEEKPKKDNKNAYQDFCPTCGKTISQCKYNGVH